MHHRKRKRNSKASSDWRKTQKERRASSRQCKCWFVLVVFFPFSSSSGISTPLVVCVHAQIQSYALQKYWPTEKKANRGGFDARQTQKEGSMPSLFPLCSFFFPFSSPTSNRDFSFPRTCLCPCTKKKLRSEKLVTENHALSSPLFLDQTDGDQKNDRTIGAGGLKGA